MLADLALVGFGNVARRFVRLLEEQRDQLSAHDLSCRVIAISTGRHGAAFNPSGLDALAAARLMEEGGAFDRLPSAAARGNPNELAIHTLARSPAPLRVMIETTTLDIRDGQPAIDHVRAALDCGCHVVTANKGPAAFAFHDLSNAARGRGLSFLFEGAVMDGIPIFNLVRETLPAVDIKGFRGVVNSTTNHILTALEDGQEFAPALAQMQADGIAEADPSLDVDGWDAAAKTAALANVFLDARITPHEVERSGLDPACAEWTREAKSRGARVRLIASARSGQRASVGLKELPADDLLAGLRGMSNALVLETGLLGDIAITQMHGGLTHTAYALLSDLLAIRARSTT
jgi:homoserine dehydrogenase